MIVLFGVEDNECHTYKGFRRIFDNTKDADTFLQVLCASTKLEQLDRYAVYIGDEFTSLDMVMHLHNWKKTDARFRDNTNKIKDVDLKQIKLYYDLEYQIQQQKRASHRAERTNEIKNMDAAALEYHRKLFQEMNVNLQV